MNEHCRGCIRYLKSCSGMTKAVCEKHNLRIPRTNAVRIRDMSDEELAAWLEKIRLYCATDLCGRSCPLAEVCYSNANAPKETLDWLREEVPSDG